MPDDRANLTLVVARPPAVATAFIRTNGSNKKWVTGSHPQSTSLTVGRQAHRTYNWDPDHF